jgi:hypothetical protein
MIMKVALYDFEVTVPNDWKIAIAPKAEYKSGMIALKPTSNSNESVDLIWEELAKHVERSPTVDVFLEQYFSNMKNSRDIKSFEATRGSVITRGGHSYLPHEFTYSFKRYMRKGFTQQIIGMVMYDTHSNRFAIFYAKIDKEKQQAEEEARRLVINSLNCSCENPST